MYHQSAHVRFACYFILVYSLVALVEYVKQLLRLFELKHGHCLYPIDCVLVGCYIVLRRLFDDVLICRVHVALRLVALTLDSFDRSKQKLRRLLRE